VALGIRRIRNLIGSVPGVSLAQLPDPSAGPSASLFSGNVWFSWTILAYKLADNSGSA
jgi:hypothetical protein